MSEADRAKWDARYAAGAFSSRPYPSDFLRAHLAACPAGRALDIACGAGRNALYLARQGFLVDAIDISQAGLDRAQQAATVAGLDINWDCQDLLASPAIPCSDYQLIIMFRFVAPGLLACLPDYLAPGGVLMVEEHMRWHKPVTGPDPRFRVEPGELTALLPDLEVLFAEEGEVQEPDGTTAALSRLLVKKPGLSV